ncbi:hypothetical protein Tco_1414992 [Tanacetum coccineum]
MEKGFLSPKGRRRGNGVKEKQGTMSDESAKVIDRTSEVANSYVVTSPAMDEPVVASRNNNGTKDGNVGQGVTPTTTTAPNTGYVPISVHESPTTDNSALIHSRPT